MKSREKIINAKAMTLAKSYLGSEEGAKQNISEDKVFLIYKFYGTPEAMIL